MLVKIIFLWPTFAHWSNWRWKCTMWQSTNQCHLLFEMCITFQPSWKVTYFYWFLTSSLYIFTSLVGSHLVRLTHFPYFFLSLLCPAYTDFCLLDFHMAFSLKLCLHTSPTFQSYTHSVFKSKRLQAVSPPSHFISLPFSSLFCPPFQNVWIDLNGVIVTALPAACLSAPLESLTWAGGRRKGKDRERERERRGGESSFEQQGMATLQRHKSSVRSLPPLQPVPYSLSLSLSS